MPTPAEKEKRRPLTRPSVMRRVRRLRERVGNLRGGGDRVGGKPERARQDARPAAGQEADRDVSLEPVQRLVEPAVPGEDDDRVDAATARVANEFRRVTGMLGEGNVEFSSLRQRFADRTQALLVDARGKRIDDEYGAGHSARTVPVSAQRTPAAMASKRMTSFSTLSYATWWADSVFALDASNSAIQTSVEAPIAASPRPFRSSR